MSTLNALLDQARAAKNISSDNALGDALGVSGQAVNKWRAGNKITEKHLAALVALASADPALALAVMQEQATTKPEKIVWGSLLQRIAAAAAVGLCVVAVGGMAANSTSYAAAFLAMPIM